jgi:3alpha(or 20beta)-hydroxysteroid dehydrogenase
MGRLTGKVALVTGGARGTGEETARLFAAEGARVVIGDVLDDRGRGVAESIGDTARYQHLDVTSPDDWHAAVRLCEEVFGPPTVLVNNAGILVIRPMEDTTLEEFERILAVNLTGAFLGMNAVTPSMREAGGGAIVNVSSVDGVRGGNQRSAYCASKWGLRGLTKAAAFDLGRYGIRVNAVCPGGGSAEMAGPWIGPEFDHPRHLQTIPLGRDVAIPEIAAAILYLASDESSYVSAVDLLVDGGVSSGQNLHGFLNVPR